MTIINYFINWWNEFSSRCNRVNYYVLMTSLNCFWQQKTIQEMWLPILYHCVVVCEAIHLSTRLYNLCWNDSALGLFESIFVFCFVFLVFCVSLLFPFFSPKALFRNKSRVVIEPSWVLKRCRTINRPLIPPDHISLVLCHGIIFSSRPFLLVRVSHL